MDSMRRSVLGLPDLEFPAQAGLGMRELWALWLMKAAERGEVRLSPQGAREVAALLGEQ